MRLINTKFDGPTLFGWRKGLELFGILWCLERSSVWIEGNCYLTRNIIYAFGGTLRLHKFWRGDDDRASHTHPWNFWTFPLTSYNEKCYIQGAYVGTYTVKRWRWHRRSCMHEHIVTSAVGCKGNCQNGKCPNTRPFYTIVVTGPKINEWGFYPKPGEFVHWRSYK